MMTLEDKKDSRPAYNKQSEIEENVLARKDRVVAPSISVIFKL